MLRNLLVVLSFIAIGFLGAVFGNLNESSKVIPQVEAQTCTPPGQVTNVLVEFPNCVGDSCNFTQASCSWTAVGDATSYNVTITQVETSAVVTTQSIAAGTTRLEFGVTQNQTYRCEVAAVNSCGASGPAGSHELFCEVDALVEATSTPVPPTAAPQPTIPPTGGIGTIPAIAAGAMLLSAIGGVMFLRR